MTLELTVEKVQRVTGSTRANAELFLPFLQGTCKAYDINTPRRIVGFLSQIGHESAGMSTLTESLNYSVESLINRFKRHRISIEDAKRFGRAPGRPANQERLANILYGGAWGEKHLGNTKPGDGWRFRGRGLKQLTGRFNYEACGQAIGEPLTAYPERLLEPINAALSAGWFWQSNGLNAVADRGDVESMTRIVNGGVNGLDARTALWTAGLEVFA